MLGTVDQMLQTLLWLWYRLISIKHICLFHSFISTKASKHVFKYGGRSREHMITVKENASHLVQPVIFISFLAKSCNF